MSLAEFPPAGGNKMKYNFPKDMRLGKITYHPANAQTAALWRPFVRCSRVQPSQNESNRFRFDYSVISLTMRWQVS